MDTAEAQHLMSGLDWPGAVKDIHASVNWLKANGSEKVCTVCLPKSIMFIKIPLDYCSSFLYHFMV